LLVLALSAAVLCLGSVVSALEHKDLTTQQPTPKEQAQQPAVQQPEKQDVSTPTMTATLVDPEINAKDKSATVQVNISGAKLIDPAMTNKKPTKGEVHLHYQVDDGPVIATTSTKLSFHGLKPGKHQIVVMLANNDHSPAGPQQMLELTVP
jgi:hypothetical protein